MGSHMRNRGNVLCSWQRQSRISLTQTQSEHGVFGLLKYSDLNSLSWTSHSGVGLISTNLACQSIAKQNSFSCCKLTAKITYSAMPKATFTVYYALFFYLKQNSTFQLTDHLQRVNVTITSWLRDYAPYLSNSCLRIWFQSVAHKCIDGIPCNYVLLALLEQEQNKQHCKMFIIYYSTQMQKKWHVLLKIVTDQANMNMYI